jgi:hypothetical protein
MRRFFAVLAVAALVAACSDQPTQPLGAESMRPYDGRVQTAMEGAERGAWSIRYPAGCQLWGWDGELINDPFYPIKGVIAPNGVFAWQCWVEGKLPNPTGKTIHFGPDNAPQANIDFEIWALGVYPVNGRHPICDVNTRLYPHGYDEFPVPEAMRPNWQCTWNWHYTITASGEARFTAIFDPGNSWYPYR